MGGGIEINQILLAVRRNERLASRKFLCSLLLFPLPVSSTFSFFRFAPDNDLPIFHPTSGILHLVLGKCVLINVEEEIRIAVSTSVKRDEEGGRSVGWLLAATAPSLPDDISVARVNALKLSR